jgi:putative transposase
MKLTAVVRLLPSPEQAAYLLKTLEMANAACNDVSSIAWKTKIFKTFPLQQIVYTSIRETYALGAQMAVRCIAKVADGYKLDKRGQRTFKTHGAIAYDTRNLTWHVDQSRVSIWSIAKRLNIPFVCGDYHQTLLAGQRGETDLVYRKGKWFLYTTCDVEADTPIGIEDYLGVDVGIQNIACDSDGTVYSATHVLNVRHRYRRLRKKLQTKGTKSAKRLLKKRSKRESRFANDVNHCVSKQLVKRAKDSGRGLALEDLTHIRTRVTVRRKQRDQLHSWGFADLRAKVTYKAERSGVPLEFVDARYTSQQCSCCGHTSRANRPRQSVFQCESCGHQAHADTNAAVNIGRRAAVKPPYAVCVLGLNPAITASLRL